jgi:hypothetical protein
MRSTKDRVLQRVTLEFAVQDFYRQHRRWPADATEFWATVPRDQRLLDQSKFRRLEFSPKADGSTFVEFELAVEPISKECFNLKPDEKR